MRCGHIEHSGAPVPGVEIPGLVESWHPSGPGGRCDVTKPIAGRVRKTYEFIKAHRHEFGVQRMCRLLEVARSMCERYCIRDEVGLENRLARALSDKFSDTVLAVVKNVEGPIT